MDKQAMRAGLEAKLNELLGRHERLTAHLRNQDRDVPIDWSDMAQFMKNDGVLAALEERTRDRVNALTAALIRLDEGSYGTCTVCGEEISKERLEIVSTTDQCARCSS